MTLEADIATEGLNLFLLSRESSYADRIRDLCPPTYRISSYTFEQVFSTGGEEAFKRVIPWDSVLWEWDLTWANEMLLFGRQLRKQGVPIIALCTEEEDIIPALLAESDDALMFPLNAELLEARIAVYERWKHHRKVGEHTPLAKETPGNTIIMGPIILDLKAHMLFVRNEPVELTHKEFELLHYLMQNHGVCCTRDSILEHVWSLDFDTGTNMIEVYMFYLRRKLKKYNLGSVIKTVRGAGYRFQIPEGLQ